MKIRKQSKKVRFNSYLFLEGVGALLFLFGLVVAFLPLFGWAFDNSPIMLKIMSR